MVKTTVLSAAAVTVLMALGCGGADTAPPTIVSTNPANGATDVDPSLAEISVTFSEPMTDGNWSWCYDKKEEFPTKTGEPYYVDNRTKNVLPVKLEPNKQYIIWLNSQKFTNFKDEAGNALKPHRFVFKTGKK